MLIEAKNKFIKSNRVYIEKYVWNHFWVEEEDLNDARRLFSGKWNCISLNHELYHTSSEPICFFNTNDFIYHIFSYVKENI